MKKVGVYLWLLVFILNGCQKAVIQTSNMDLMNKDSEILIIDIKGAVRFPGVYQINSNKLLNDIINMAGGLMDNADLNNVNLASIITNNQMIVIPFKKNETIDQELININQATKNQLMTLPGIGEAKAQTIINYRNEYGFFNQIEDLMKVSGIGQAMFDKIKMYITIS